MFDIGWSEMAVVALIALLVIGPKELPNTMRMVGRWTRKARALTREFRSGFDEMVREAELEDVRKTVESAKAGDISKQVKDTIDPTGWVDKSLKDVEKTASSEAPAADLSTPSSDSVGGAETIGGSAISGSNGLASETKIAPAHSIPPKSDTPAPDTPTTDTSSSVAAPAKVAKEGDGDLSSKTTG